MHQHIYTGGSWQVDHDVIYRYCLCGAAFIYNSEGKRKWNIFQDDNEYYRDMAKRLLAK